jgi:hypothetical protein
MSGSSGKSLAWASGRSSWSASASARSAGDHAQAQENHADLLARFAFLQLQGTVEVRGF